MILNHINVSKLTSFNFKYMPYNPPPQELQKTKKKEHK